MEILLILNKVNIIYNMLNFEFFVKNNDEFLFLGNVERSKKRAIIYIISVSCFLTIWGQIWYYKPTSFGYRDALP